MKIQKFFNKKEGKEIWQARFQLNNKEFTPKADSRKKLLEMVDEIRAQEHRTKYDLPVPKISPTLKELFTKYKKSITVKKEQTTLERAAARLLDLIEKDTGRDDLRVVELKRAHLQLFIDDRLKDVKPSSANREMTSIAAALHKADRLYSELEDWICPKIPRAKSKRRRRERLITPEESGKLIAYLTRQLQHNERPHHYFYRIRLAHTIEFFLHTGLRRKENAALKKTQYDASRRALLDVKRWKTGTVTKFFPLTKRAAEILEERMLLQPDSEYIFSKNGKPVESHYRKLQAVCKHLEINYGKDIENGFVLHDARHNFATRIIKLTDIETARELTGHAGDEILTYLHTSEDDLIRAMRAFEGANVRQAMQEIFDEVKDDKIDFEKFLEKVKNIAIFGTSRENAGTSFSIVP
ncbi:MAG: tyrosine-type recombinase/integrase [Pyrinomonadaceae bacterium]